jgi:DNA polymerase I-like protein with 3'-5' exonuclease and polymerase domains
MNVYPHMTYDQIKATEQTQNDIYTQCKRAVFAMLYGGEGKTLQERLGVPLEVANAAYDRFIRKYRNVGRERRRIFDMFCSMRQPAGIGTKVEWHEPADYLPTMFGFKRYFTLENRICKALFELANKIPKSWQELKIKVQRRDRTQTAAGAVCSALYAAAFAVQAANMRAAANHVIQGGGAQVTKRTQRAIWDLQPTGVHPWYVRPLNIHDEIQCPTQPAYIEKVAETVKLVVEEVRDKVPLIKMKWKSGYPNWAAK